MWGKEHKKWRAHNFSITEESPYQQWFAGNLFQGKLGEGSIYSFLNLKCTEATCSHNPSDSFKSGPVQ